MKHTLCIVLCMLLSGCAASAKSLAPVPTPKPTIVSGTIAFIGDSLTAGFYATDIEHSFPALLEDKLGPYWHAVGYGKAYSTTEQAIAKGVIFRTEAQHPTAIVVELGTNDAGEGKVPLATFETMYRYLLSQLQVIGHPKIYCLTTWDEHAHGIPYDEVIKRSCALVRGTPVDISKIPGPGMAGPAERLTQFGKADGWHPNDAGHAAIANKILQVF